jgi:ribonuclease E
MPNKMLIDATHPEETRVVVIRGNRVEEFDFETAQRKQLRGNIYLAKVTRVEPSLQAAFIEYGGNRHGFLAFSEIHPDYYQIPVADRQALIEADERAHREAEEETENRSARGRRPRHRNSRRRGGDRVQSAVVDANGEKPDIVASESSEPRFDEMVAEVTDARHDIQVGDHDAETAAPAETSAESSEPRAPDPVQELVASVVAEAQPVEAEAVAHHADDSAHHEPASEAGPQDVVHGGGDGELAEATPAQHAEGEASAATASESDAEDDEDEDDEDEAEEDQVESVGGDDVLEEVPERAFRPRRQYKIQEVIKRRQVMLVQVVKEERGNKGAALTTYLSLAGRYAVLMPNTARGGGISRKITSAQDRSRLKDVVSDLDVPEGMGIILRTAGASRTKPEIKRDFEYLIRMWETVRDTTLKSQAPTLVYEEGSLIKRSLRDLYTKEIDEIQVAGDAGYREAHDFMKMLMPQNTRVVKQYRDGQPLFSRMGVESQLDQMFQPRVELRSGGYIILNQTEALVSIDVNSGRSTKEHHIEDTALKTNMEAAEEVARQLRLRDLAGLIVIDFIDMDEKRNNRAVERKMSDCLRQDRARIQVGRISHFGLLEMSRQRIRASVLESSTEPCAHCGGLGHVRSVSSVALQLVRSVEEILMKGATHNLTVRTRTDVALYVLNHKRANLRNLEDSFKLTIAVIADATMQGQQAFLIERGEMVHSPDEAKSILAAQIVAPLPDDDSEEHDDELFEIEAEVESEETEGLVEEVQAVEGAEGDSENFDRPRRKRRRRRGRGEGREDGAREPHVAVSGETQETDAVSDAAEGDDDSEESAVEGRGEQPVQDRDASGERRPRRRGRRGGRRRRNEGESTGLEGQPRPVQPEEAGEFPALTPADDNRYWNGDENSSATQAHADRPSETHLQPEAFRQPEPAPQPVTAPEPVAPAVAVNEVSADAGERAAARRRSTVREKVSFGTPPTPTTEAVELSATTAPAPTPVAEAAAPAETAEAPRKAGWWSRRFGGG